MKANQTMKLNHLSRAGAGITVLIVALLTACGGGDEIAANTPATLSGRVTNAAGATVANARVIAMDRATDMKYTTEADEFGHYEMRLPRGHFDVATDDESEGGGDTAFLGLLSVSAGADVERDFKLPDGEPNVISGTVLLPNGEAAVGYTLRLSYNQATADDVQETVTDTLGQFKLVLNESRLLDLDIFDPQGNFVEFIDMHKLGGHLHAEIQLAEGAQQNLHRHDQTPHPLVPLDETAVAPANDDGDIAFQWGELSGNFNVVFYGGRLTPKATGMSNNDFAWYNQVFTGGGVDSNTTTADVQGQLSDDWLMQVDTSNLIKKGKTAEAAWEEVINSMHIEPRDEPRLAVFVGDNGKWGFDYAVNIKITDKGANVLKKWDWQFMDESEDQYSLTIRMSHWHCVSYNSDKPAIVRMGRGAASTDIPIPVPM